MTKHEKYLVKRASEMIVYLRIEIENLVPIGQEQPVEIHYAKELSRILRSLIGEEPNDWA